MAKIRKNRKLNLGEQLLYWLMVLPAFALVFLFITRTWPGVLIAFEDFIPAKGWYNSEWVGLNNFKVFFMQPDWWKIIRNSVVISLGKTFLGLIVILSFSLMLNEIRNQRLKKFVQTCTYLLHFVSWVIFATILKSIIGPTGVINSALYAAGLDKIPFLSTPWFFPILLIITDIFKGFGWSSIIYLAGIAGIDPALYEVAEVDGASRWQMAWHITLPCIKYVIVVGLVMSMGQVLAAGFDQVFNLQNDLVMSTGDVLETWIYRQGIVNLNYGVGAAVGLFCSLTALLLTALAYFLADKLADYKIF